MLYQIILGFALLIAMLFSLLVFVTGKGDAMSGGGGIRTTYKGKASFDDLMSRMTLYFGIGFIGLTLVLDAISNHTH